MLEKPACGELAEAQAGPLVIGYLAFDPPLPTNERVGRRRVFGERTGNDL